ncbi:MAG: alpha-1,2-fucosyltransferase [Lachnospiraceae bacterium]
MEEKKRITIATELLNGQGLGNQLFCYIAIRGIAKKLGADFSILNASQFANNIHSNLGMYFMDLESGCERKKEDFLEVYHEKEERIFLPYSNHDLTLGCYITGEDSELFQLKKNTLIYGNLQSEIYFKSYQDDIKKWLHVKEEYNCMEYSKPNLCIVNVRGGEYTSNPELFLRRKYWIDAINHMKKIRKDMEFMVITDDVVAAKRVLPELEAFHFELSKDYTIIKNAHYFIASNSTFSFFPIFTSDTIQYCIAPKYWARHNVSDGYWASEQNIYTGYHYLDRSGRVFTADECREELKEYKMRTKNDRKRKIPYTGIKKKIAMQYVKFFRAKSLVVRALFSIKKRIKVKMSR